MLIASQHDRARVPSLLDECLAVSREIGLKEGIAASFWFSGQVALGEGDLATAGRLSEKSIELYREMGHRHGTSQLLAALGKILAAQGDYTAARTR